MTRALTQNLSQLRAANILAEAAALPAGDALWVAQSKDEPRVRYTTEFVVERKSSDDLVSSIIGGRYHKQKYVLARCGLRQPMYLVEGHFMHMDESKGR